ncbi:protein angel homolog 1 [Archocentrus centrarchus]|uniref:protein angel homolog 1 n=1 Tax=Archocentrus centrarchus TaxID=63155 RepID=UPI0011E9FC4F|nr:protein angel homolog 1 [Archocentrus centrarchus]
MIGSLMFYALYYLSRYLHVRPSEASKKDLPPAVVNGKAEWDAKTRRFTNSQTAQLDQWLSPTGGSKGETKERVSDLSLEEGKNTRLDMNEEPLLAVPDKDMASDGTSKMTEVQSEVKQKETGKRHGGSQENLEDSKQEDGEMITHHKMEGNGEISPTEEITPQEALETQAEDSIQETTCHLQKTKTAVEETERCDETAVEETECWDEYLVPAVAEPHDEGINSKLVFFSSEQHNAQTNWHFPVGPGLTEEVECPLLPFPSMSYYPPAEPVHPFEVMWRLWVKMDESATSAESAMIPFTKASMDFTVMSYNILAQDLLEANQELYTHCPLEVLDWNYRCNLLLKEIEKWLPDILCLQEVQENHYHEQLHPALSQMGYNCVFKRRTGTKTDGCATCFRSSCFSEVAATHLEFFRPETRLLDRHNVGIVLLLRPLVKQGSKVKEMGPPLCIANTHLLFNPRRGDVKLAQLAIMLAEIDSMIKSCKAKGEHCNVIMCGDFNSVPYMPLYQFITTSELYYQGLPTWLVSGQEDLSYKANCYRLSAPLWPSSLGITDNCQYTTVNEIFDRQKSGKCQYSHNFLLQLRYCPAACVRPQGLQLIPGVTDHTPDASRANHPDEKRVKPAVSHRLNLESVYKHILPGSGNPEVTTLHSEFAHTVDYIFYSPKPVFTSDHKAGDNFASDGLKLLGCLSLLSEDVLWSMNGLPNHTFASDHLSLMAKFQLDISSV